MIEWPTSVSALLTSIVAEPAKSEKALKRHFRAEAPTTHAYRLLLADTLLGTLCFRRRLKFLLLDEALADVDEQGANAVALACIYWWNVRKQDPPAGLLSFLPRELHSRVQRAAQKPLPHDTLEEIGVFYSHPDWMVSSWSKRLPLSELHALLQEHNRKAPVWIRFFSSDDMPPETKKSEVGEHIDERIAQAFQKENIDATPHDGVKNAFRLMPRNETLNVWGSPLWQAGAFEVQDLGSQIIVAALSDVEGRIADVCAGAGGKTLALSDDPKKTVFASDVNEHALVNLKARLRRHQTSSEQVGTQKKDSPVAGVVIRQGSPQVWQGEALFSAVLVDAPCSSTGTLRRGPARRWSIAPQDPKEMAKVQLEVLDEAAALVEEGGVLLYATCSLQCTENEDIVLSFLRRHQSFSLEAFPFVGALRRFLNQNVPLKNEDAMMTLWPHRTGTDGFFVARLRRHSKS